MPSILQVPTNSADIINTSLEGISYDIKYRFSSREERWYFDIYLENGIAVKLGVKVMENQSLLSRYVLDDFKGDIICFRKKDTPPLADVGRDNLGIGKAYELIHFTSAEIDEIFNG
jgi:hypothetical protein